MAAKDWRNLEELEIVSRFGYSRTVEKYIRWLQNTEIEEITIVVHTHSPRAAHTESRQASVSPKQYGALLLLLVTAYFYIVLSNF